MNKFTKIDPLLLSFDPLSRLKKLNMSENQIISIEPRLSFAGLDNTLVILDLSVNRLVRIEGETFSCLKQLKELFLNENRLVDIDLNGFKGLENSLELLNLSKNELSKMNGETFKYLRRLKKLNLWGNQMCSTERSALCVGLGLRRFIIAIEW